MIVDGEWPADCAGRKPGKPTYRDIAAYAKGRGGKVSEYAIGRYARRLRRFVGRWKEGQAKFVEAMNSGTGEQAARTSLALSEMLTAVIIEHMASKEEFDPTEIRDLARATKHCTDVSIAASKHMQALMQQAAANIKTDVTAIRPRKGLSRETLKTIREQIYGIVDEHLGTTMRQTEPRTASA
jgi:hypothetical protein